MAGLLQPPTMKYEAPYVSVLSRLCEDSTRENIMMMTGCLWSGWEWSERWKCKMTTLADVGRKTRQHARRDVMWCKWRICVRPSIFYEFCYGYLMQRQVRHQERWLQWWRWRERAKKCVPFRVALIIPWLHLCKFSRRHSCQPHILKHFCTTSRKAFWFLMVFFTWF